MSKDYYSTLGISKSASADEIKRAYKKLAVKYHPDVNKDKGAEEKFKEINEAYQVLSDPKKKQSYDQFGSADYAQGFGGGSGQAGFGGFDFSGFAGGGGGFEDIFEAFFGGQTGGRRGPARGRDIEIIVELAFEEAVFGTEKKLEYSVPDHCATCQGVGGFDLDACATCHGSGTISKTTRTILGSFAQTSPCPTCHGKGKSPKKTCGTCHGSGLTKQHKTIEITIPAGVDDGTQMKLAGYGEAGAGGHGDLYVRLRVKPHPYLRRDGATILSDEKISFATAALGGVVPVQTVSGEATLDIPSGTQPGTRFTLRGKGVPHTRGRGDHIVTVTIAVPKKVGGKEKELLEELKKYDI